MQMGVVVFVTLKHFPSKASASVALWTKTAATNVILTAIKAGDDSINTSFKQQKIMLFIEF